MQTVLQEIETIVNNRPLTYVYTTELETCITPNHLFGRTLSLSNPGPAPLTKVYSSKMSNIINHLMGQVAKGIYN